MTLRFFSTVLLSLSLIAGTAAADTSAVISELLGRRVAAPEWEPILAERIRQGWKPPAPIKRGSQENTSLKKLVGHWVDNSRISDENDPHRPSPEDRERLLKAAEEHPALFEHLARFFVSTDEGVTDRIQRAYETIPGTDDSLKAAREACRNWLMLRGGRLSDELQRKASSVFQKEDTKEHERYVEAFVRLQPDAGRQLLIQHAEDKQPAPRLLALRLLHERKPEQWREALQKFVTSDADTNLRRKALERLAAKPWPEFESWFLSQFTDAKLGQVKDGYTVYEPLASIVAKAPDAWIPKIIPLVGNPNRSIHDNAVRCLVQFHLQEKRADALHPLLPWLSDPEWALTGDRYGRLRLVQSLEGMDLPECVPGLLKVLESANGYELRGAAEALAYYKATQAVPQLKKALMTSHEQHIRRMVADSIMKLEGFTDAEVVEALETYARENQTAEGRNALRNASTALSDSSTPKASSSVLVAAAIAESYVYRESPLSDSLTAAILKHARTLKASSPEVAAKLELFAASSSPDTNIQLLKKQLADGDLTSDLIVSLLGQEASAKTAPPDLTEDSISTAVLAVQRGDVPRAVKLLASKDATLQAMVLACARLKRLQMPLESVTPLLESPNILCKRAATLYLEVLETPEAREILWQHFPDEVRILGARMGWDPGHSSYKNLDEIEDSLQQRLLAADGPQEIWGMLSAGYWGNNGQIFLEKRADGVLLIQGQDGGRQRTRMLTNEEWAGLQHYLQDHRVDDLPPLNQTIFDGMQYEYVHLTRKGGVRVFMNNPGSRNEWETEVNDAVYTGLLMLFKNLTEDESLMKPEYSVATKNPGLEILIAAEKEHVETVMGDGGRLFIKSMSSPEKRTRWRALDGQPAPVGLPLVFNHYSGLPREFSYIQHLFSQPWFAHLGEDWLLPLELTDKPGGLFRWREGGQEKLVVPGTFADPMTTEDGRWIVAARQLGKNWGTPNDVVRIEVSTGMIVPVDLPPADDFDVVIRLPGSRGFILKRSKDSPEPGIKPQEGPMTPAYHLLNAETGSTQPISGDFAPFTVLYDAKCWRDLQPTGQPDQVWGAKPLDPKNFHAGTQIGRYDLRTFRFETVQKLPGLIFGSMDFWMDEPQKRVLLTVNGDLLAIPFSFDPVK